MRFPTVGDIATLSVTTIADTATLQEAIDRMVDCEHRNIVVTDGTNFSVLNILDIVKFQNRNYDLSIKLFELHLPKVLTIEKHKNILETLDLITQSNFICVLNADYSLYGLVSHSDIIENIDPSTLMENYRLKDFFKIGKDVQTVVQNEITLKVFNKMAEANIDNVVIMDEMKPIGITTTKDVMRLIKSNANLMLPIRYYMVSPVDTVENSATIKQALEFIKEKHYQRVVVVDEDGFFAGVVKQSELISLTYSNWAVMMQEYQEELSEINTLLENKNREYEYLASTDSLTGLYNRYKFTELFVSSYATMVQREADMSLLMLDIDFFKRVNDTYGHDIGDKVLVQISHAILRTLRNIDVVGRWGGEEFVMLLPTANLENATFLAEKIRKEIENLTIDIAGHVTVSLGVTTVKMGDTLESALKRADDALYLAKDSARNCYKVVN